ncbi:hypothetical protein LCGC14_0163790 [marine sediment metagenome]|uniref:Uncharacterized protein n=1 Tax=marine sediment metagenome TaxID=412755 RepID=A0A0F9UUG6_9ZZZZ
MNVGELKAAIGDLPDEAVVVVTYGVEEGPGYIYYEVPTVATCALAETINLAHMADMLRNTGADFKHGCLLITARSKAA